MNIKKTELKDINDLLDVFAYARELMKQNGNPNQWGDSRPYPELILKDIEEGNSYVIEENGEICGTFAFIIGVDPTYHVIENGEWLNNEPYGTIHRIASNGKVKGIWRESLRFCENLIQNIRVDTHKDNLIMQHALEKSGFTQCGIIYVDDGTPRIAYQKVVK